LRRALAAEKFKVNPSRLDNDLVVGTKLLTVGTGQLQLINRRIFWRFGPENGVTCSKFLNATKECFQLEGESLKIKAPSLLVVMTEHLDNTTFTA
jgi:hypothetical protein